MKEPRQPISLAQILNEADIERLNLRQVGKPVASFLSIDSSFINDISDHAGSIAADTPSLREAKYFMQDNAPIKDEKCLHEYDIRVYAFVFYAPKIQNPSPIKEPKEDSPEPFALDLSM